MSANQCPDCKELADAQAEITTLTSRIEEQQKEIAELKADNTKLRETLEKIALGGGI